VEDSIIPVEKSNQGKVSKKPVKKINRSIDTSASPEIVLSKTDDSIVENSEVNVEQNAIAVKRIITIQIFEDEFIFPNYKDNKEKFDLWDELMGKFFPIKTDSVTLRSIMNQIKLRKATREGLMNTPEELATLTHFFDQ
jgi:flagellar basal body P-ring protein FlgI